MNNFLPANIGTFVTLVMFVAIIPAAPFGGAIAAYLVQKIFYTLAGTFVYLYMFLSVPGVRHQLRERHATRRTLVDRRRRGRADRDPRPRLLAPGEEAVGPGERRRRDPLAAGRYLSRVFLPSFLGWLCSSR